MREPVTVMGCERDFYAIVDLLVSSLWYIEPFRMVIAFLSMQSHLGHKAKSLIKIPEFECPFDGIS